MYNYFMFLLVYVEYKNNCTQIHTGTPSFVLYTVSNVILLKLIAYNYFD